MKIISVLLASVSIVFLGEEGDCGLDFSTGFHAVHSQV